MKREQLYAAMGAIEEPLLERSESDMHKGRRRRMPRFYAAVAAVLVLCIAGGVLLRLSGGSLMRTAYAIEEAEYPDMAPYPNENSLFYEQQWEAWQEAQKALRQPEGYADGLAAFFRATIPVFLSEQEGENSLYSPVNVYMALGMLAEITGGESRQQILELVGAESVQELRSQAQAVWRGQYRNDGATTTILANSLWLNEDVAFVPEIMAMLAENYYASSYRGEMGSPGLNRALQNWMNTQTGGLLEEQAGQLALDAETVLALASTLFYQAKWDTEFMQGKTEDGVFHSPAGDTTAAFMHSSSTGTYYWGERFGAVGRAIEEGGTMWLLLPDEGVRVESLLEDPQAMGFLLADGEWENSKRLIVNLALPKFDVTSECDLLGGLAALGVRDILNPEQADFTPMAEDAEGIYLSAAQHSVRVAIDEEGVTAAAYTVMAAVGAGEPPEEEVDFVLDRPFLFAITSADGLPLFVGVVNQPNG